VSATSSSTEQQLQARLVDVDKADFLFLLSLGTNLFDLAAQEHVFINRYKIGICILCSILCLSR